MRKKEQHAPDGSRKDAPAARDRRREQAPSDSRDEALVARAYGLFDEYIQAYAQEWQRIDECERLYRGEHWQTMAHEDGEPTPVTPILHSTVESVAADIVARAPQAIIEPESPMDTEVARVIGALIRQNHDASDYRSDYRRLCHDLLVSGYCVQEVGYDPRANNGIGSAYIRYVTAGTCCSTRRRTTSPIAGPFSKSRRARYGRWTSGTRTMPGSLRATCTTCRRTASWRLTAPRACSRSSTGGANSWPMAGMGATWCTWRGWPGTSCSRTAGRRNPRAILQAATIRFSSPRCLRERAACWGWALRHLRRTAEICRQAGPDRAHQLGHGQVQQAAGHGGVRFRPGRPARLGQGGARRPAAGRRDVVFHAVAAAVYRGAGRPDPRGHQAGERRQRRVSRQRGRRRDLRVGHPGAAGGVQQARAAGVRHAARDVQKGRAHGDRGGGASTTCCRARCRISTSAATSCRGRLHRPCSRA